MGVYYAGDKVSLALLHTRKLYFWLHEMYTCVYKIPKEKIKIQSNLLFIFETRLHWTPFPSFSKKAFYECVTIEANIKQALC